MLLGHSKSLTSGMMALSLRMLYPLSFGIKRFSRGANPFLVCPIIKDSKFLIDLISIVVSDCLNQESKAGRLGTLSATWWKPTPSTHLPIFSAKKSVLFLAPIKKFVVISLIILLTSLSSLDNIRWTKISQIIMVIYS